MMESRKVVIGYKDKKMNIKITIKQLGKKRDKISEADFTLENKPITVAELIKEAVHTCVTEYNLRVRNNENIKPLTEEQITDMSEIGKIAFGINYGGREADEEKAVAVAIQAFEDGLVRIFKGTEELTDLSKSIEIKENDLFTFIRLTMLSGRMF